jgi:hypothetical protein
MRIFMNIMEITLEADKASVELLSHHRPMLEGFDMADEAEAKTWRGHKDLSGNDPREGKLDERLSWGRGGARYIQELMTRRGRKLL